MAEVDITLHKEKYRTRTLGEKNGAYKTRTGNSHASKQRVVIMPHRRRYPWSGEAELFVAPQKDAAS